MQLTNEKLLVLRRIKGERNLTTNSLSKELGLSRHTLGGIINGRTSGINSKTMNKIETWLAKKA